MHSRGYTGCTEPHNAGLGHDANGVLARLIDERRDAEHTNCCFYLLLMTQRYVHEIQIAVCDVGYDVHGIESIVFKSSRVLFHALQKMQK